MSKKISARKKKVLALIDESIAHWKRAKKNKEELCYFDGEDICDGDSCRLCIAYEDDEDIAICHQCPLYIYLGDYCDNDRGPYIASLGKEGTKRPMLDALRATRKMVETWK